MEVLIEYSWTVGLPPDYPAHGEIDIIENINENTFNLETLHTNAGCNITNSLQKGTPQDDGVCDNNFQDGTNQYLNQGCSVKDDQSITQPSYGTPFNDLGGGAYVMVRTIVYFKYVDSKILRNGQVQPSRSGISPEGTFLQILLEEPPTLRYGPIQL
jgi:hypothetical protein